jgi:hypothetical protein
MVRRRYTESKAGSRKTTKLKKEALKVADEKAREIAEALCERAIDGNISCARMLVELADGAVDGDEAISNLPLRSIALELASEPLWTGPIPD